MTFPPLPQWPWRNPPQPPPPSQPLSFHCPPRKPPPPKKSPAPDLAPSRRPGSARRRLNSSTSDRGRLDPEFDVVLVPSDGGCCLSGSDSDDSDWSIGWFEPHSTDFSSDDESENSFAVLVPCYGSPSPDFFGGRKGRPPSAQEENFNSKSQLWAAVLSNISKGATAESKHYLDQWLSSLQGR